MHEKIQVVIEDRVGTLVLNRSEQHNAIDFEMWGALTDAASRLGADGSVDVVVVTGAGQRAFSAGADIKDFPTHRGNSKLAKRYAAVFEEALNVVEQMPKPTISMIRGICFGGGCELAMATDLRIAATGSTFAIPVAKIGVLVGYSEMQRLIHLVGPGQAANLLLTAREVDEQEALRIGLVTEVVPENLLTRHTYGLAKRMAAYSSTAQSGHKRIMRTVLRNPNLLGLSKEDQWLPFSIFDTEDGQEGYQAFVEKRLPRFKSR